MAPVYALDEAVADPHARARDMVAELEHPDFGCIRQVGVAPKLSRTPGSVRSLPPRPGANAEEILREAEFSETEIRALVEREYLAQRRKEKKAQAQAQAQAG